MVHNEIHISLVHDKFESLTRMNSSNRYQSAATWSSRLRIFRTVMDGNSYLSFTPLGTKFIWWISPIIFLIVIFAKLSFVQSQVMPVVTYKLLTQESISDASETIKVELNLTLPNDYVFPTHPTTGGRSLDGGLSVKVFSDQVEGECPALWAFRFYPTEETKVTKVISIDVRSCTYIENQMEQIVSDGVIVIDFYDLWYTWKAGPHHDLRIQLGDGYSGPTPPRSMVRSPSAPTSLSATSGNGEILFSWDQPSNNGGESVTFEYHYGEGNTWTPVGTDTSVTVGGLTNGIQIIFYVRARNSAGPGNEVYITETPNAEIIAPSAPTNLRATPRDGAISFSWAQPSNNGGESVTFEYHYGEGNTWTPVGTDTNVTVGDLTNGIQIIFYVRARNSAGPGAEVNIPATPNAEIIAPSAPTNLHATPRDGAISFSWAQPSNNGGESVTFEYHYGEGNTWTPVGTNTSVTVGDLTNGIQITFHVRARNSAGPGAEESIIATPEANNIEIPRNEPEDNLKRASLLSFEATAAQAVLNSVESRLKCLPRSQKQTSLTNEELLTLDYQRFMANRRSSSVFDNWFPEEGDNFSQETTVSKLLSSSAISSLGNSTNFSNNDSFCESLLDFSTIWGHGAVTTFDSKEGETLIDGSLTSFILGSDFTDENRVLGVGISLNEGWGDWRGTDEGKLEFSMTGLYPYFGMNVTDETSIWGVTGLGRGSITYKPKDESKMKADTRSTLIAGGFRQALSAYLGNFDLSLKTNFFSVKTETEATSELTATNGNVTRTSIILEGSCDTGDGWCADLNPTFGVGARYDGGDHADGYSLVVTSSVDTANLESGVSAHLNAQGVVLHEEDAHEVSISGTVSYDQNPTSDLGWSMSVSPTWGESTYKGNHQNLGTKTIAGLFDSSLQFSGTRIDSEIKYGTPIANGKFAGTTNVGYTYSDQVREYRVGYSVSERQSEKYDLNLSLNVQRTEKVYEDDPNHSIGLRVGLVW